LHERAFGALDRCQESQSIDFKESATWDALKWRTIKTVLGMGNLRDGGVIVVGASQRDETWDLAGISAEDLETYDVDTVTDVANSYASPHAEVDVVLLEYRNCRKFLVIQVKEFADTPLVCRKNGPPSTGLQEGYIYVRPPGVAHTTRITNAAQMHDLLELAAEKLARRILEVSRRVGLVPAHSSAKEFDDELGGL
jgi:hypothetical protein